MKSNPPKVIVLDFDGVVVESCYIKRVAMDDIFEKYRDTHPEILDYVSQHPNLSRHEKFEHILSRYLPHEDKEARIKEWVEQYAKNTRSAVIECEFVEGAEEFLKQFSRTAKLYLASATPQDELDLIMTGRNLTQYFKGVHGAPINKAMVIRAIMSNEGVKRHEILFVGDSPTDLHAAIDADVPFVGRERDFEFPNNIVCKNLKELKEMIEEGSWR
jgi:phosphoglycolate phosphatase-like HAD superfamily hydrolase